MNIISHRGNLNGSDPMTENTISQVHKAIDIVFSVIGSEPFRFPR